MKLLPALIGAAAFVGVASVPASAALFNVTFAAGAIGEQGSGAGFENAGIGALPSGYTEAGAVFTPGGASVQVKNTTDGNGAFPFGDNSTKYLSVLGGPSNVDVAFGAGQTRVGFYWGSVDAYNTVQLLQNGNVVGSLTGADLLPSLVGDGNQGSYASNRYVTIFLAGGTFDTVRFSSTSNSFEIDNISAAVPEPSTWAMMLLGFFGLSFATLRRRRKAAVVAA